MEHFTQQGSDNRADVFALIALALATICGAELLAVPDPIEGVRRVIRLTARISLALFLGAFLASSLARLRPGATSRWLVANRRALGLGFALSHMIHAGALAILYNADRALFWSLTNPVTVAGGSITYGFIAALAFTSFDGAVRMLGAQRWRRLHTAGVWVIWLVFLISNAKRIPASAAYTVPSLILIAALVLRVYAARGARRLPATT